MNIRIRKSIPGDVYGIRQVQRVTWRVTYPNQLVGITVADIEEKFEKDGTSEGKQQLEAKKNSYRDQSIKTWVVEDGMKIVGFCVALREGKVNRIGAIYMLPDYQGKGLGQQLMNKALTWLGKEKLVVVNVAQYNQQAIDFYRQFGFTETGNSGALDKAATLPSGKIIPEIELVKHYSQSLRR